MSHPILLLLTRAKTRQTLRAKGHSLAESIQLASLVDDDMLDAAVSQSPEEVKKKVGELSLSGGNMVGAIGDGSILKLITDFLGSDLGKALIAIILSLLTG